MGTKLAKTRLDQLLVEKNLVENASKARARIMAGDVIVNDHRVDKPGDKFLPNVEIRLRGNSHPFVSRGGLKLEYALTTWPCDIQQATCMDVGASTGGFSEVLLEFGAQKVYAVDVGYGQLAQKLRSDPRIINLERTHILQLDSKILDPAPSIIVVDVSFISLTKILPKIKEFLTPEGVIYALVKPQFEVGREFIAKGGIVKNSADQWWALDTIIRAAIDLDLKILGAVPSPILGTKGNVEFLLALKKPHK
jgi:23S rRNA (cytidine1920-2'-O)/16S rRNA (cytidine1409-2'-O)-methyltransferase